MKWWSHYLLTLVATLSSVSRGEKAPLGGSLQGEKSDLSGEPAAFSSNLNSNSGIDSRKTVQSSVIKVPNEKNWQPTAIPFLNFVFPTSTPQEQQRPSQNQEHQRQDEVEQQQQPQQQKEPQQAQQQQQQQQQHEQQTEQKQEQQQQQQKQQHNEHQQQIEQQQKEEQQQQTEQQQAQQLQQSHRTTELFEDNRNVGSFASGSKQDGLVQQSKYSKPEIAHKRRLKTTKQPSSVTIEPVEWTFQPTPSPNDINDASLRKNKNLNFGQAESNIFPSAPKIADLEPHDSFKKPAIVHQSRNREIAIKEIGGNRTNDGAATAVSSQTPVSKSKGVGGGDSLDGAAFSRLANDKFAEIIRNLSLTGFIKNEDMNNEKVLKNISDSFTVFMEKALQEQNGGGGNGGGGNGQEQILNDGADYVIAEFRKRIAESYSRQNSGVGHGGRTAAAEHNENGADDEDDQEQEIEATKPHPTLGHKTFAATRFINLPFEQAKEDIAIAPVIGSRSNGHFERVVPNVPDFNRQAVFTPILPPDHDRGLKEAKDVVRATLFTQQPSDSNDRLTPESVDGKAEHATEKEATFTEVAYSTASPLVKPDISEMSIGPEKFQQRFNTERRIVPNFGGPTLEERPPGIESTDINATHMIHGAATTTESENRERMLGENFSINFRQISSTDGGEAGKTIPHQQNTLIQSSIADQTTTIPHEVNETHQEQQATVGDFNNGAFRGASGPLGAKINRPDGDVLSDNVTVAFGPKNHRPEIEPPVLSGSNPIPEDQKPVTSVFSGTLAPQLVVPTPLTDALAKLNSDSNETTASGQEPGSNAPTGSADDRFPTPPNFEILLGPGNHATKDTSLSASPEETSNAEWSATTKTTETPIRGVFFPHLQSNQENSQPYPNVSNFESIDATRPAFVILPENETEQTGEIDETITTAIFILQNATQAEAESTANTALFVGGDNASVIGIPSSFEPDLGTAGVFDGAFVNGTLISSGDHPNVTTIETLNTETTNANEFSEASEPEKPNNTINTVFLIPGFETTTSAPNNKINASNSTTAESTLFSQTLSSLLSNATQFAQSIVDQISGISTGLGPNSFLSNLTNASPGSTNYTIIPESETLESSTSPSSNWATVVGSFESTASILSSTNGTTIEKPSESATWHFKLTDVEWDSELSDKKSWQYRKLSDKIYPEIQEIFKDLLKDNYVNTTILGFSQGSIVVSGRTESTKKIDFVQFSESLDKSLSSRNYKLADHTVDPASINVDTPGDTAPQTGVSPAQRGGVPGYVIGIIIAAVLVLAAFFGAAYCVRRYRTSRLRDDRYVVDAETMNGGGGGPTAAVKTWQRANGVDAPTMAVGGRPAAARMAPQQPLAGNVYEMKNNPMASTTDAGVARVNHGYEAEGNGRQTNGSTNKKSFQDIDLQDSQRNEASSKH